MSVTGANIKNYKKFFFACSSAGAYYNLYKQDAQLSQRPRCTVRFGQKWKTGTGRQYFTDIIGLFSTTVI